MVSAFLLGCALVWSTSKPTEQTQRPRSAPEPGTHARNLTLVSRNPTSRSVIQQVQSDQRSGFALLRTPAEGLPRRVRKILRQPKYGMNWMLAQRLPVRIRAQVWIVPGRGILCMMDRQNRNVVGTSCVSTTDALRRGVATTYLGDPSKRSTRGNRVIFGMVPDQAREVVARTHGTTVRIPVVGGVFVHRDDVMNPPDQLTLVKYGSEK